MKVTSFLRLPLKSSWSKRNCVRACRSFGPSLRDQLRADKAAAGTGVEVEMRLDCTRGQHKRAEGWDDDRLNAGPFDYKCRRLSSSNLLLSDQFRVGTDRLVAGSSGNRALCFLIGLRLRKDGTATINQASAPIDKLEIVLRLVIVLVSFQISCDCQLRRVNSCRTQRARLKALRMGSSSSTTAIRDRLLVTMALTMDGWSEERYWTLGY